MGHPVEQDEAHIKCWLPSLDHMSFSDWEHVYEPAEDTFLLLDALYTDRTTLRALRPAVIVELGPGSGVVSSYLSRLVGDEAFIVAIDVNPHACTATADTALANSARVDVIRGDLLSCVRTCDALVFNPPYVTTPPEELRGHGIEASWAGGVDGRQVIDRLLSMLGPDLIYLLVSQENKPHEIIRCFQACDYEVYSLFILGDELQLRYCRSRRFLRELPVAMFAASLFIIGCPSTQFFPQGMSDYSS